SFSSFCYHQFQALEQRFEFGMRQCSNGLLSAARAAEAAAFEAFTPDAVAAGFEVQTLQLCAPAVDEDEAVPVQRITAELVAYRGGQAVIGTAHVGGLRTQPKLGRQSHEPRRIRRQTPSPKSSSIS